MKCDMLIPKFVVTMPDKLEEGVLYISEQYATAIHLCACGCGIETVTPLQPQFKDGWRLIKDGLLVSLEPSIGNQKFPCKSHYVITKNKIIWC
jgi:hypothetical protein